MARILMVLRPGEGGAFQHVETLSRSLIDDGHDVALCGPHEARSGEIAGEVIPVDIVRPLDLRQDFRAVGELKRAIANYAPDLIHAHGSKGGVMTRLAALSARNIPLISTPHGYAFAGPLAKVHQRVMFWLAERATTPIADRIICVCEHEARLAHQFADPAALRVVHNGVPLEEGDHPDPGLVAFRGDGPLITCVSGLRRGKGLETLIAAFSIVVRRHPEARLALVGGGPERERVERQIALGGLEKTIRVVGAVEHVTPMLLASDVFVGPSWSESFPYAVLEAMALGLPIVATDVGGVAEAIIDCETGLLVEARSACSLADALSVFLTDPAQAAAMGAAAARAVRDRFTLSRMIAGTYDVYGELLGEFQEA